MPTHRTDFVLDDRAGTWVFTAVCGALTVAMGWAVVTGDTGRSGTATRLDWAFGLLLWGSLTIVSLYAGTRIVLRPEGLEFWVRRRRRTVPWAGIAGLRLTEGTRRGRVLRTLRVRLQDGTTVAVAVPEELLAPLTDAILKWSPHLLAVEGMDDP